jgi:hypothetical protein
MQQCRSCIPFFLQFSAYLIVACGWLWLPHHDAQQIAATQKGFLYLFLLLVVLDIVLLGPTSCTFCSFLLSLAFHAFGFSHQI